MNISINIDITLILFDLGGVLVELDNFPELVTGSSNPKIQEKFWRSWLNSDAVRTFEKGKIDFPEFVVKFLDEHQLNITPAIFISKFKGLPKQVYEGADDILQHLHTRYQLAVFSNNNEIHWDLIINGMGLRKYFSRLYASHLIGKVKPDIEAFQFVVDDLGCLPSEIFFLDDNMQNVESARSVGMQSERVRGVKEMKSALKKYNIL